MREILFRGKRIDNGEWVEGGYYREDYTDHTRITFWNSFGLGFMDACRVDPSTVGQYTGLTDKNGENIFEGDVVRITERGYSTNGVVIFENGYPGGWLVANKTRESKCSLAMRTDLEVIGTVHDNPELLEV